MLIKQQDFQQLLTIYRFNMKKKRLLIIVLLIIIVPIVFYQLVVYSKSLKYEESTPPRDRSDSLRGLVVSLLQNEDMFAGSVQVNYIDPNHNGLWNKAEIRVLNTSIADDSIGAVEYISIAEKKNGIWELTKYKSHWKCARSMFLNFWTTNACI